MLQQWQQARLQQPRALGERAQKSERSRASSNMTGDACTVGRDADRADATVGRRLDDASPNTAINVHRLLLQAHGRRKAVTRRGRAIFSTPAFIARCVECQFSRQPHRIQWRARQILFATEAPDLIFVSEVRFPAAGPPGCKANDGKPRRRSELSKGSSALRARPISSRPSFAQTITRRITRSPIPNTPAPRSSSSAMSLRQIPFATAST